MKHFNRKKSVALLLALTLVLAVGIGGTLAFLHTDSNTVTNSFEPGRVECSVVNGNAVQNDGNVQAYIRVAIVANWVPEGSTDSSVVHSDALKITSVSGEGWTTDKNKDGYYYYNTAVNPDASTNPLSVTLEGQAPTGYEARVQILAEAIQVGGGAAKEAWGVSLYGSN